MKILLIVIISFLILMYIYTYIKHKKRRQNQTGAVESFRKNYLQKNSIKSRTVIHTEGASAQGELKKQITKYNSSLDYIERNDFIAEINEQKNAAVTKTTIKPRRLQY